MAKKNLAPLSGIAGVILIVVSFMVGGDTPDADAPASEIVSYYSQHDSDLMIAAGLLTLGAFFMLVFAIAVSAALRKASGDVGGSAWLSFAGGIILAVGLTIFAGLTFATADVADKLEPAAAQALNLLNEDMFFPLTLGNAAFLLGSGVGVVKTGILPKWLGWVAVVLGVVALTPGGFVSFMLLGLWTLVVSVLLFRKEQAQTA